MKNYFIYILFVFIILNTVQSELNTEYAKSWQWKSQSTSTNSYKGNNFHGQGTSSIYADLPAGIEIKDEGTMWSLDIQNEFHGSYFFCIGIQPIEKFDFGETRKDSTWQYHVTSIAACSDKKTYHDYNSDVYISSPMDYDNERQGKYDAILQSNKFIITNERYGRNTRIEFTIDPTLQYFPYFNFGYTNSQNNLIIQFNSCFSRCLTCKDWDYENCLTCKQTSNSLPAPSCECKNGFTHYYNNQSNEICQAVPNYYEVQPGEWTWESIHATKEPIQEKIEIGQYAFDSGVYGIYSPIPGGLTQQQDGTKWTVKLVDTNSKDNYVCFGMQIVDHEKLNKNRSLSTSICTDSNSYKANSLSETVNGKIPGISTNLQEMKFDLIFTSTYLTITNIPYHGTTDVVFEYDNTKTFYPWIGLENNSIVQVNKCSPRCITCEFMQPEVCITCSNSANRNSAPDCACKDGMQDTYRRPNVHKIHSECIQNYEYYVPQPPEWQWTSQSKNIQEIEAGVFKTLNGYSHTFVQLGNDGIKEQKDGTKWSVKILEHEGVTSGPKMCFGVQKTERQYDINWDTNYIYGALVCTNNGELIQQDSINITQVKDIFPVYEQIAGQTIDFIFQQGWLIITNEEYGGNVRYEIELYDYLNYNPVIYVQSLNTLQEQVVQVHNCSKRCITCPIFQPNNCYTCSDQLNRPEKPDCICKAGMEDYYDDELHTECRIIPQWNQPKPPQWIWYSESPKIIENLDINSDKYNFGIFRSIHATTSEIKLKENNIIQNHTKWTVRILQHHDGNNVCFGIKKQELYNDLWTTDQRGLSVSQCTNGVTYNGDNAGLVEKFGEIKHVRDQSGETYDLYYENHKLIVSNENHGGYYRSEFPLKEKMNYTPYIYMYGYEAIIQVKGCSTRCKTCYDWDPERCIECNNNDNRYAAPSCKCQENYNDVFDGNLQNYCKKVEYYNEMKPPQWRWVSSSTYVEEDIADKKDNYGTFSTTSTYGTLVVDGMPVMENYSKYTLRILSHVRSGQICMGVIEAQRSSSINFEAWSSPNTSCFDTSNKFYNKDGLSGSKILYSSPRNDRESLNGEVFEIMYRRDLLTITNENYRGSQGGRIIKAEIQLNPDLNYMPFIGIYLPYMKVQLKGCSKRCESCLDWKPRQCLTCSDSENRLVAPCCLCKSGMYDYYNYLINEQCIAEKNYRIATFPEMYWTQMSSYTRTAEQQDNMGTFRVLEDQVYDIATKDFVLTEPIQWEIKFISHTISRYQFIGLKKADVVFNEDLGLAIGARTDKVQHCPKAQGCFDKNVIEDFPDDEQELIGQKVMCIYEPELFRITTLPYGGNIDIEFQIDPNVFYIPYIRLHGYEDSIQVKSCNLRCGTCKDWFPNECYTCKGKNRDIAPACGCLPGYTDIYHNQQNEDCIENVQHEHPYPNNWIFQSFSTKTTNLGNGVWQTNYGFGKIYADLGFNGINGENGGTKWSMQFYDLEATGSYTCFGIAKNEKILSISDEGNNYAEILGLCEENEIYTGGHSINQYDIETDVIPIGDMMQSRFDFHYETGFFKISNTAYGGHKHIEFDIIDDVNYFPIIINYSNSINYNQQVNTRPCHFKCQTCDNSISTTQCTECSHVKSRNPAPSCDCKDGYYEHPDGFYKCMQCDGNCTTCEGPSQCLTCKISPNRYNSPPNCSCISGFFEDLNFNCQPCDYKCEECAEEPDQCSKCKVELYRDQNSCECLEGYFEDSITQSCVACPPQCKQCTDASGICTECACDRVYYDGTNTSCPCPDNAFGVSETSGQCQICSPPCKTCLGETECLTCIFGGNNRQGPPSCSCEVGYYEDTFNNCKQCVEGCARCEVYAYRCLECIVDPNRNQDIQDCSCKEGYITSPDTGKCVEDICPDKCDTCEPGSNTQCLTCKTSLTRKDISENCECLDTHYDIGTLECKECQLPCLSCSDETTCLTCITTQGRNPTPDCTCLDGYFENSGNNCIKCHYKCDGCETSADNCKACIIQPNREQTGQCNCKQGYVEDALTKSCIEMTQCAVGCLSCDLSTPDICQTCQSDSTYNRKTIDYNCACKDGYYENNDVVCLKCQEPCLTCSTISICKTCSITGQNRQGPPTCACEEGYEEDENQNCVIVNLCPVEEGRKTSGDCSCLQGYFENSQLKCQKCDDSCSSCSGDSSQCTTCATGYKSDSAPTCTQCDILCSDCLNSPNICTSCVQGRQNPPTCECMPGYYDDGVNPECQKCDSRCGSCSESADNCTSCKGSSQKKYDNCKCWAGYYQDESTGNCLPCSYNCLTCSGNADNCLVCREGKDRIMQAPACACKPNTFETPYNNNCEYCSQECQVTDSRRFLQELQITSQIYNDCSPLCKSCNSDNQCQVCLPGKNTSMIPPLCECLQGFYLNESQNNCLKCSQNCQKCSSNSSCQECKQDMLPDLKGQCQCKEGTIINQITQECQKCQNYQGKCYLQCPENTILLKNSQTECISINSFEQLQLPQIKDYDILSIQNISVGVVIFALLTLVTQKILLKLLQN